jgi:hypothetical protein
MREPVAMTNAHQTAIVALLEAVESAHGNYETAVLGGVRDEAWAQWYANYLLAHGLAEHLENSELSPESLATRLAQLDADYRRAQPNVPWSEFYAQGLTADAV